MKSIHKTFDRIKRQLGRLDIAELRALRDYIEALIEAAETPAPAAPPRREVVEEKRTAGVCYRLEYVKCGKPSCRCATGEGHGPYWFGYFKNPKTGRPTSKYIGKRFRKLR